MRRKQFPFTAARVLGEPLLMEPLKLQAILAALGPRLGLLDDQISTWKSVSAAIPSEKARDRVSLQVQDGVAVIDVFGPLVHRSAGDFASGGPTSYSDLSAELQAALSDDSVDQILLVVDSPGGEAAGAFDFADEIFAARGKKPICALAADCAASAAYLIASAADTLLATQTAKVGSIGVYSAHVDLSAAETMAGIRVTLVHAGDRKVDGSPHSPLTDAAKAQMQASVDETMGLFVASVARNRGITQTAVRATQASMFSPAEAEKLGLIDGLIASSEVFGVMKTKYGADLSMHLKQRPPVMVAGDVPNEPATSGDMENHMDTIKKVPSLADAAVGGGADLALENDKLKKDLARLQAQNELTAAALKSSVDTAKAEVIKKHVDRGALVPAMLASAQKLAGTVDTADELDAMLKTYPVALKKADPATVTEAEAGNPGGGPARRTGKNDLVTDWREAAKRFGNLPTAEKYGRVVSVRHSDRVAILDDGTEVPFADLKGGRG